MHLEYDKCQSAQELQYYAKEERQCGYLRRARIVYQMIIDRYRNKEQDRDIVSDAYISLGFLFVHTHDKDHNVDKAIECFNEADKLGN